MSSISGVTTGNVISVYTPPPAQQQAAKAPQQTPKTDTVSISKQAQQLAKDGDTQAQEATESGAEKSSEALRGKA